MFQQLGLQPQHLGVKAGAGLAVVLQALNPAIQPVQAFAQGLNGRSSGALGGAVGQVVVQRPGAVALQLPQRGAGVVGLQRTEKLVLKRRQVAGQEGAAQLVARQSAALVFEGLDRRLEPGTGPRCIAHGLRHQTLAGEAAHLHSQLLASPRLRHC